MEPTFLILRIDKYNKCSVVDKKKCGEISILKTAKTTDGWQRRLNESMNLITRGVFVPIYFKLLRTSLNN